MRGWSEARMEHARMQERKRRHVYPHIKSGPKWVPNCITFGAPLKSLHLDTYPICLDFKAYLHLYINPPLTQGHPSFGEATP